MKFYILNIENKIPNIIFYKWSFLKLIFSEKKGGSLYFFIHSNSSNKIIKKFFIKTTNLFLNYYLFLYIKFYIFIFLIL